MSIDCDYCKTADYSDENPRVFLCQQRPSDHSEMCCTLAGHKNCLARNGSLPAIGECGGVATGEQWEAWIEGPEARKLGFLFLSL